MDYSTPPQYGAPVGGPMQAPHMGAGGPQPPSMPKGKGRKEQKDKGSKSVTKRVVDRQLKFAGVFAVIVAVVAAVVMWGASAPSTFVVVAKTAVAAGTAVDVNTQFDAVPMPEEYILPDAIRADSKDAALELARSDVNGLRAQYPITVNQQVGKDQFNFEINLAEPLGPSERLVSVEATVASAVAGTLVPGDHVDVFASADGVSGLVLSNVPVVSVTVSENQYQAVAEAQTGEGKDTKPGELLPGTPVPGIYVMRVPADAAAKLATVNAGGDLSLIYVPKDGAAASPSGPLTATGVICEANPSAAGCTEAP